MSGQTSAGQVEEPVLAVPRKRRRSSEDGRIVTNVPACLGAYITEQADDLGISPSTFARMLMVEAVKGRGLTMKELEVKYPAQKLAVDRRTREGKKDILVAVGSEEAVAL